MDDPYKNNLIQLILAEEEVFAPHVYIQNAACSYQDRHLFQHLALHLKAGRTTALLGPSGIGKSSLLRLLAGISTPELSMRADLTTEAGPLLPSQVVYMAQKDLLLPWLNVLDNVLLSWRVHNFKFVEKETALANAKILLAEVGLEEASKLYPHQLSGGMRQRTALVRTLLQNRPIVLLDEPFAAVDTLTKYKLQNLAADLLRNKTVLIVTHDPLEALRLADDLYVMQGTPAGLKHLANLNTKTPRGLEDEEVQRLQAQMYAELMEDTACSS